MKIKINEKIFDKKENKNLQRQEQNKQNFRKFIRKVCK